MPGVQSIRSIDVFRDAATDNIEMIDRISFILKYRISIDLASNSIDIEYLRCSIGGIEWMSPSDDDVTPHFKKECAGPTGDTRNDCAAALGCVETSATGLLNPTIFERLWSCQPSFSRFLHSNVKLSSQNLLELQFRVVADESLFFNTDWALFCNVKASMPYLIQCVQTDFSTQ